MLRAILVGILPEYFHFEVERNFAGDLRIEHFPAEILILRNDGIEHLELKNFRHGIAGDPFYRPVDRQNLPAEVIGKDDIAGVFKKLAVQILVIQDRAFRACSGQACGKPLLCDS